MSNYAFYRQHLQWLGVHRFTKVKVQLHPLKIFRAYVGKVSEPDFFRTYKFQEVLDNIELVTDMKFHKMIGCRDMGKNIKNAQKIVFSPFVTPHDHISKIVLSLLYPSGALTSCKN